MSRKERGTVREDVVLSFYYVYTFIYQIDTLVAYRQNSNNMMAFCTHYMGSLRQETPIPCMQRLAGS